MSRAAHNGVSLFRTFGVTRIAFSADHSPTSAESASAVDTREQAAALVLFQWYQPSFPPTQNVNSAVSRQLPAMQCSGNSAICATVAAFTTLDSH